MCYFVYILWYHFLVSILCQVGIAIWPVTFWNHYGCQWINWLYLGSTNSSIHYLQDLWYTPHTKYGLRHVQDKFIQDVCGLHHLQGLICGIHHILGMAYAMFEISVYKMFVVYTTYKVRLWSTPHTRYGLRHVQY